MAENTKIQWCHSTFNPWRGCTKVAPGCANCYAEAQSKRNPGTLGVWGPNGTRVVAAEPQWRMVERLNREAGEAGERWRVFVASLADVFEDWPGPMVDSKGERLFHDPTIDQTREIARKILRGVDPSEGDLTPLTMPDVRNRFFRLADRCENLDLLLVTKRPENVRKFWPRKKPCPMCNRQGNDPHVFMGHCQLCDDRGWLTNYRKNVWLLTSVSDQQTADAMVPELLKCRDLCPVLGISAEPLLGPIDIIQTMQDENDFLDWAIIGCESGPCRRPMHQQWAQSLVDQCLDTQVACFVKQVEINGKVCGEVEKFPASLQVREYPS